jgi:hypothetical protein
MNLTKFGEAEDSGPKSDPEVWEPHCCLRSIFWLRASGEEWWNGHQAIPTILLGVIPAEFPGT